MTGVLAAAACAQAGGAPPMPLRAAPLALAGGYRSIYSFGERGKFGDGNRPVAALVAVGGRLFGTTETGGATNAHCNAGCGSVFSVSTSGTERVIHRFQGGSDGAAPLGELTVVGGKLIGTTSGGGASGCGGGCGTLFSIGTDGTSYRVLYRFAGGSDGGAPAAGLIAVGATLYGTTRLGGVATRLCSNGCGTVFAVSASGTERVIYRFKGGKDGAHPIARLVAASGALYGTTQYGGLQTALCATGCGTLFQMSTAGIKKTIHNYAYGPKSSDGAYPAAGATVLNGKLYGTTLGGGRFGDGTVFEADPSSGAERVLHAFSCCGTRTDGSIPSSRLARLGNILYGTTRDGGISNAGTIFSIRASGSELVIHDFGGKPDGATPQAGPIVNGSMLYGTTSAGGSRSEGTVFELKK
ncbi:MAG TPA: choice-of-anchor tandem repeat GloVer-containing protein [Candidatus Cybelea sp.]|nr:choice-of-anchor tandem repeat GloVer-containing protein [Candidatus Cybelea sp.]